MDCKRCDIKKSLNDYYIAYKGNNKINYKKICKECYRLQEKKNKSKKIQLYKYNKDKVKELQDKVKELQNQLKKFQENQIIPITSGS